MAKPKSRKREPRKPRKPRKSRKPWTPASKEREKAPKSGFIDWLRGYPSVALLAVALLAVGIYVGIDALFTTERERVEQTLDAAFEAINQEDLSAFLAEVSPGFYGGGASRDWLEHMVPQVFKRWDINVDRWRFTRFDVSRTGRIAEVEINVHVSLRAYAEFRGGESGWKILMDRDKPGGKWLIKSAEPRKLPHLPPMNLSEMVSRGLRPPG